jgi:hypothetical protein
MCVSCLLASFGEIEDSADEFGSFQRKQRGIKETLFSHPGLRYETPNWAADVEIEVDIGDGTALETGPPSPILSIGYRPDVAVREDPISRRRRD